MEGGGGGGLWKTETPSQRVGSIRSMTRALRRNRARVSKPQCEQEQRLLLGCDCWNAASLHLHTCLPAFHCSFSSSASHQLLIHSVRATPRPSCERLASSMRAIPLCRSHHPCSPPLPPASSPAGAGAWPSCRPPLCLPPSHSLHRRPRASERRGAGPSQRGGRGGSEGSQGNEPRDREAMGEFNQNDG